MSQTKKLFALAFSGLAFSLFTPFNIALAAEARAIEEIIVQARRQDETLQDVPVTITSVGGDQLDHFVIEHLAGCTNLAHGRPASQSSTGYGGEACKSK